MHLSVGACLFYWYCLLARITTPYKLGDIGSNLQPPKPAGNDLYVVAKLQCPISSCKPLIIDGRPFSDGTNHNPFGVRQ